MAWDQVQLGVLWWAGTHVRGSVGSVHAPSTTACAGSKDSWHPGEAVALGNL